MQLQNRELPLPALAAPEIEAHRVLFWNSSDNQGVCAVKFITRQ